MTTHRVIGRGVQSWTNDPESAQLIWESGSFADHPRCITNPELEAGTGAVGIITAVCNGIDFDYKFNGTSPAAEGDGIVLYAMKGLNFESLQMILYETGTTDWTNVHADLEPGEWNIVFGIGQGSGGPVQGWFDNFDLSPTFLVSIPQIAPTITRVPTSEFTITAGPSWTGVFTEISAAVVLSTPIGYGPTICAVPTSHFTVTNRVASLWSIPRNILAAAKQIYTLTLSARANVTGVPVSGQLISGTQSTLPHGNIIPGSITMRGYVLTLDMQLAPWYAQDDATGRMTGPGGIYLGTIDYETGAYNVGLGAWIFGPTTASYQYSEEEATPADLELPMSSFTATLRDSDPSYLSCVVPNSTVYADAIEARTGGEMIVRAGYLLSTGIRQLEEIARADLETVAIDQGTHSDSVTLVGHKTVSSSAPKSVTVSGVSYYGLQHDGCRKVRAAPDLFLRCGDTIVYGSGSGESFVAGQIWYNVTHREATMEVTERSEETV